MREEETRRLRNLDLARQRQREVEWQQKNEAMRLEREKERIRSVTLLHWQVEIYHCTYIQPNICFVEVIPKDVHK